MNPKLTLPPEGVILCIDKPADWTSFDVVNKIRQITGIKKVGHAGTLDPFATGVLLICLGGATRRSDELMQMPKEYVAEIALGKETDTLDLTGQTVAEAVVPPLQRETMQEILRSFIGESQQEIPSYSAAKFRGRRLYKLARKGEAVPRLFKKVTIYELELIEFDSNSLRVRVLCGKGTYIRSLARDIARRLGTVGHVRSLVRTRVGRYSLRDALSINDVADSLDIREAGKQ